MSTQCRQNVWRGACQAHNAYNPVLAIRSAFGTTASCLKGDDHIPSMWEPPTSLPANTTPPKAQNDAGSDVSNTGEDSKSGQPERKIRRSNKKPGGISDPARVPTILKSEQQRKYKMSASQHTHREVAVDFVSHKYWQQHMAHVRGQSFRVQRSQFDDERASSLQKTKRFLEYDAKVVQPEPSRMKTCLPIPWALDQEGRKSAAINSFLASEINRFADWIKPTPVEERARAAVIKDTEELIRSCLTAETTGVALFGSEKNGIALPFSDIDIRIFDAKDPNMPHSRLLSRLRKIMTAMHDSNKFMLATIRGQTHPILNCQHRESGIDIQIVAGDDSSPQQEVITKYIHEIPRLKEVYFLVRTTLSMRGLVDVYTGGMGSYGTFVMVLAVLERDMRLRRAKYGDGSRVSSATQLIAFLEFYRKLDTRTHGVAVHPRTLFKKHEDTAEALKAYGASAEKRGDLVRAGQWELCIKRPLQPYLLCLQDPANPLNDLGMKGHAIKHIHATLAYLNQALAANCFALKNAKQRGTKLSTLGPLLLPLVGRCHEVYYERRKKLEMFGNRLDPGYIGEAVPTNPVGQQLVRRIVPEELPDRT